MNRTIKIEKLTSLTLLDLSENKLTTLPKEIEELRNLKLLRVNRSTELPCSLKRLTELQHLQIYKQ